MCAVRRRNPNISTPSVTQTTRPTHPSLQISGEAFVHLRGIQALSMSGCDQDAIETNDFEHLEGIVSLTIDGCTQLSGKIFAHLRSLRILSMIGCDQESIEDGDFEYLHGVLDLNLSGCTQITSAALEYLSSIHNISVDNGIDVHEAVAALQFARQQNAER